VKETISNSAKSMDAIVALCRRRGFVFQSSEIYGGIGGFWDFGPLGVLLKNNIRDRWWRDTVLRSPTGPDGKDLDIVGLDCSIISHPRVWEASGHVGGFADPMQTCRQCKRLHRADQVAEQLEEAAWVKAFVAAVLGGIGSIPGAMVGGLLLGVVETLVSAYLSSTYRDAIAFVILIAILLYRPTGLFGTGQVEKV